MLLALVEDIAAELGFENTLDMSTAVNGYLNAADALLQSRLGTVFAKGVGVVDTFYAHEPGFTQGVSVQTQFRLSRGFVKTLTEVVYAATLDDLGAGTNITATVVLDPDKGVLRDMRTVYAGQYVRATYTAGFDADTQYPEAYKKSDVPEWLRQLAKLKCKELMAGHPQLKNAGIDLDAKALGMQYEAALIPKTRYAPVALLPL